MSKKKVVIILVIVLAALAAGVAVWVFLTNREYRVKPDEIALRIKLDVQEDVGLIVYDYSIDGHDFSGGVSNADRSLIGKDEELIITWSKEELQRILEKESGADSYDLKLAVRIITEYVDPNYENVYPEEITKYLKPIEWTVSFGNEYDLSITGDKTNGYDVEKSG